MKRSSPPAPLSDIPAKRPCLGLTVPVYVIHDGRRWVEPYYHSFTANAKKRWWGKSILDIYAKEFVAYSPEYYKDAIETGKITVNGEKVGLSYVVNNGDVIAHNAHVHEPSVLGTPVKVIAETEHLVVINKPASMTTYRSGLYTYNSVPEILCNEHPKYKEGKLLPLHRLDRVVSDLLKEKKVQKYYISRVCGKFPNELECNEKIGRESWTRGKNCVDKETGKEAKTQFYLLSYSATMDQSLVLCKPLTGRQHQLRVHLSHLGFPIVHDKTYLPPAASSDTLLKHRYPLPFEKDSVCPHCKGSMDQVSESWDEIYLHAYFYSITGEDAFSFRSPLPNWSQDTSFEPLLTDQHPLLREENLTSFKTG